MIHIKFQPVQWLILIELLKVQVNTKAVENCKRPKFDTCEFVKGHRQTNKIKTTKKNHMKEKYIKKEHLIPGHMLSVDSYILRYTGRIYYKKGDPSEMFSGGCVLLNMSVIIRESSIKWL